MKELFLATTVLLTGIATTPIYAQTQKDVRFKVDTCYPVSDKEDAVFNFCGQSAQKLYEKIAKTETINFANDFILTKVNLPKVVANYEIHHYVAINPKTRAVFVSPFEIGGDDLSGLKLEFKKDSNRFCFIDLGNNAAETQVNSHPDNQQSRFGDVKSCIKLDTKQGFEFDDY